MDKLFDTSKYKAKLILLNGNEPTVVKYAFQRYKMPTIVQKFQTWILTKKYGDFITAIIEDGNGRTLLKYVNTGSKIELREDNWN